MLTTVATQEGGDNTAATVGGVLGTALILSLTVIVIVVVIVLLKNHGGDFLWAAEKVCYLQTLCDSRL